MIKKIISSFLSILMITSVFMAMPLQTFAADGESYKLYAVKDWVQRYDMITMNITDTDSWNSTESDNFRNAWDELIFIRALDQFDTSSGATFMDFIGPTIKEHKTGGNGVALMVDNQARVRIKKLTFEIEIYNKTTGEVYPTAVVKNLKGNNDGSVNGYHYAEWELLSVYSTGLGNRQVVDLGQYVEMDNVALVPYINGKVQWNDNLGYKLRYFQINDYQTYDLTGEWTTNYIADTLTQEYNIQTSSGVYTPTDTKGKWVQSATTSYSENSAKASFNSQVTSWGAPTTYDVGKTYSISAYSKDSIYNIFAQGDGNNDYRYFYKGDSGYVSGNGLYNVRSYNFSGTAGIEKVLAGNFDLVYWDYNGGGSFTSSADSGWCRDVTGYSGGRCYKHTGHTGNSRFNEVSTDGNALKYQQKYIVDTIKTESTLYEVYKNGEIYSRTNGNLSNNFIFNEDGIWKVKTTTNYSTAGGQLKTTVTGDSGEYKVDATPPEINQQIKDSTAKARNSGIILNALAENKYWVSGNLTFDAGFKDNLSGVNTKTSYSALTFDNVQQNNPYTSYLRDINSNYSFSTSGVYVLESKAVDNAGNQNSKVSTEYLIDVEKPTLKLSGHIPTTNSSNEYIYVPNQTVTINATDMYSGVKYVQVNGNNIPFTTKTTNWDGSPRDIEATFVIDSNKDYVVRILDNSNPSNETSETIHVEWIDKDAPNVLYLPNSQGWTNAETSALAKITDKSPLTDVYTRFRLNNGAWSTDKKMSLDNMQYQSGQYVVQYPLVNYISSASGSDKLIETGIYEFYTVAKDKWNQQNTPAIHSGKFYIDTVLPTVGLEYIDEWTRENVDITINMGDAHSGLRQIVYPDGSVENINFDPTSDNNLKTKVSTWTATDSGIKVFSVRDVAGNITQESVNVKIDRTPPQIIVNPIGNQTTEGGQVGYEEGFTLDITVVDSQSGPAELQYCTTSVPLDDNAGNIDWSDCTWKKITVNESGILNERVTIEKEGKWYIKLKGVDKVGNETEEAILEGPFVVFYNWIKQVDLVDFAYIQSKYNKVLNENPGCGTNQCNTMFYNSLSVSETPDGKHVTERAVKEGIEKYSKDNEVSIGVAVDKILQLYNLQVQ